MAILFMRFSRIFLPLPLRFPYTFATMRLILLYLIHFERGTPLARNENKHVEQPAFSQRKMLIIGLVVTVLLLGTAIALYFLFGGKGKGDGTSSGASSGISESQASEIEENSITIEPVSLTLTVGESAALSASQNGEVAESTAYTWSSSDEAIATVTEDGAVTARAAGSCTITASLKDAPEKNAAITVTVTEAAEVKVTGISLSETEVTLTVGASKMPIVTMAPENATNKGEKWTSDNTAIAKVNQYGNITGVSEGSCTVTVTSVSSPDISATVKVTVTKATTSLPSGDWALKLVAPGYAIDQAYQNTIPLGTVGGKQIDQRIVAATQQMIAAAKADGVNLGVMSGYRTIQYQINLFNRHVQQRMAKGMTKEEAIADTKLYVAVPGESEHNLGLAIDFMSGTSADLEESFANTPQGKWLKAHAADYGFILRYPKDKQNITKISFEPWHYRYVGVDVAKQIMSSGKCLEEYLGVA